VAGGQTYRRQVRPPVKSSETALHMAVARFIGLAWPPELPWTHFPAGELRDKGTAGKLKAMGLKPGWGDFIFVLPNAQFAELELKVGSNGLSAVQIEHRQQLLACGATHAVATSLEEVEAILSRWLAAYGLKLRATINTPRAA
jgi:hypothetical protein